MRTGRWRRAFCTSVQEDSEGTAPPPMPPAAARREEGKQQKRAASPRSCTKLSFFSGGGRSNPSTPRLAAAAGIRCWTRSKSPGRQRLQCDMPPAVAPTSSSSASAATPPSPRSPSKFAFFKHHSRSRCLICSHSLKPSQDPVVFKAECSHDFHFPCIAAHAKSRGGLACPVCSVAWSQIQFIPAVHLQEEAEATAAAVNQRMAGEMENRNPNRRTASGIGVAAKVYDDDEPLLASNTNHGGALRFNPIPEAADEDKDDNDEEYGDENVEEDLEREDELHGLLANPASRCRSCAADGGTSHWPTTGSRSGGIQVSVMLPAALISEGRRHRNCVVALKVKAPPMRAAHLLGRASGRAPIDLVMVMDVSGGMTGDKPQMLKRSMRLVISSLGPADRLSMIAFSAAAGAKRLLPLRRMSRDGQRTARQIVERLVMVRATAAAAAAAIGGGTVGDAFRKATKVLEDRRERNPVGTVMLLSDATKQQQQRDEGEKKKDDDDVDQRHHHKPIYSPRDSGGGGPATRFDHPEIPVIAPALGEAEPSPKYGEASSEDAFIKCVGGLVPMVVQDVQIQLVFPSGEISTVYLAAGGCFGSRKVVELRGGCCVLRLGYLCAEEERELLVELRVPSSLSSPAAASSPNGGRHHLSVKCNYKDPATQAVTFGEEQLLFLPPLLPQQAEPGRAAPSSSAGFATSQHLRNLFVSTRAVVESRRLAGLSDHSTAHRLLSSARALLLQSTYCDPADRHLVQNLDSELADLQRRQRHSHLDELTMPSSVRNRRRRAEHPTAAAAEARGDPLTPTSAWRTAEQLAKVAIMRKSLNRVGDLHGFENARF